MGIFHYFFWLPISARIVLGLSLTAAYLLALPYAGTVGDVALTVVFAYVLWHSSLLPPSPLDSAEFRRQAYGTDFVPSIFRDPKVQYTHSYMMSADGRALFTRQWRLREHQQQPKGIVLFLHGYSASSGYFTHIYGNRLARHGFVVCCLDHMGHGRSDGLHCYVPSFQKLVDDALHYIGEVRQQYPKLKLFLMAESMGGAIALHLSLQHPSTIDGMVLMAPMAKIADHMKPPPIIVKCFTFLAYLFPTLPISPIPDLTNVAFKRRDIIETLTELSKKTTFGRKPRLGTAFTFLHTSIELERNLHRVAVPFLVLHGDADKVTDPQVSQALYQKASSADKTLKLYSGAWHTVIIGEPDDMRERVFTDIIDWIEKRL